MLNNVLNDSAIPRMNVVHLADVQQHRMHAVKGCSTVQKIVIEIVIEIDIEQARLFECDRFHYAENWQSPSRLFLGNSDLD